MNKHTNSSHGFDRQSVERRADDENFAHQAERSSGMDYLIDIFACNEYCQYADLARPIHKQYHEHILQINCFNSDHCSVLAYCRPAHGRDANMLCSSRFTSAWVMPPSPNEAWQSLNVTTPFGAISHTWSTLPHHRRYQCQPGNMG